MVSQAGKIFPYLVAVAGMSLVIAIFLPLRAALVDRPATVAVIQIVVVVLTGIRWGTGPALVAALTGALAFNYFFLVPYYTFIIAGVGDIALFLAFLTTSLIAGSLAAQAKRRADDAETQRHEIERLYADLQRENSARKRVEQALIEARDEMLRKERLAVLGQVAGSVGHELRNPLGVMNNAVFFLKTALTDADPITREYLDIIAYEIKGAEGIVSELLDSVRTRRPQLEISDTAYLIRQAVQHCTVPEGVTLRIDIPAGLPPIAVDPQQIQRVFRNLISNGIEAMSDNGSLTVSAISDAAAGTVRVSIRDTGSGIGSEQMAKLFQPLCTTKARGIGLGLVVCKNLVEVNGGQIEVQSEAGKGTTFTVTLPGEKL